MNPLLRVESVETAYFDRLIALSGVSLDLHAGRVLAILGPNGAGKTTLLRSIAGLLRDQPRKGTIQIDGVRVERRDGEQVARHGVVYVPEDRGLFRELTVEENLRAALWGRPAGEVREDLEQVHALFPLLAERAGQQAETLSGGQQQMLAISRALLRRPKLLLLDEPFLGLAPLVVATVFTALGEIARSGAAILLVEQNAPLALSLAPEAAILESGRIVLRGTADELRANPDVREAYLGLGGGEQIALKEWRLYRRRRRW